MTDSGQRSIGLVVEAPADADTARLLVDRVLSTRGEWVEDNIEYLRAFRGCAPDANVSYWKHIPALCKAHGVVGHGTHGKFDGKPGAPDALAARRALLLFMRLGMPDAIVMLRDADDQPERLEGLRQARDELIHREQVAIGVAVPEREAWYICAFTPSSPDEHEALREQRRQLGFDPTLHPDRLGGEGKRNAKPVFAALTKSEPERARRCLTEPTIDELRARGPACGLTAFMEEIRERIAERLF